jgi:hypothetical protein
VGVLPSSPHYKRDIHDMGDMGDASDKLMKLRPVSFRYKADPTGTQQHGLIAEEVAKVYPELVVNGADGKTQTVAYHLLPAMLLNEMQKQAHQLAQKDQIATCNGSLPPKPRGSTRCTKDVEFDAQMTARMDALEQQARAQAPSVWPPRCGETPLSPVFLSL